VKIDRLDFILYNEFTPESQWTLTLVYQVLCQEIEIQISQAHDHPEEGRRFPTIMQCALILEGMRKDAAVRMGLICSECFESLVDNEDGIKSCNNPSCSKYFVENPKKCWGQG
jgi:hypothetical protein